MALPRHIASPLRWLAPLLVVLVGAPASAYVLRRDSSGEPVRWETPVRFVVEPQLDAQLRASGALSALRAALAAYEEAGVGLQLEEGEAGGVGFDFETREANRNAIVVPTEWEYDTAAIAVTVLTVDSRSHRILDADIALNAQHRDFRVLPADGAPAHSPWDDVQNTLTHELGHAVGLAHNPEAPDSVMYPTALRGETSKRVLSADDRAGLAALYVGAAALGEEVPAVGCSASDTSGPAGAALLLLVLAAATLRRRRPAPVRVGRLLLPLALLAGLRAPEAAASSPERQPPDLERAALVATGRVVRVQTQLPSGGRALLRTEVEVEVERCYRGPCPRRLVVVRPGGRWGHVEQLVEGHALPDRGEPLGVVVEGTDPSPERPAPRTTRLYSLARVRDLRAFAAGLARLEGRPAPAAPPAPGAVPR